MNNLLDKWNRRWRERVGDELVADSWLLEVCNLLPVSRTLDLACGRGRNTLELARRGFALTAVDFSEEALTQLSSTAAKEGLRVDCLCCDLENRPLVLTQNFDLVMCFFYLHRPLFPTMLATVRPGGLAMIRTFSSAGPFPPGELDERFILQPGELLEVFSGWEILRHEEGLEPSRKGGSLAAVLARKPL